MARFRLAMVGMVAIGLTACQPFRTASQRDDAKSDYVLVWSDEFDQLDTAIWNFEEGLIRNEELQYYQRQNAYVENGVLMLEARAEQVSNPQFEEHSDWWQKRSPYAPYSSGSIHTEGTKSWQYGRFEVRAKVDTSLGLWPAFWTLGIEGEWPGRGEIDILEYYRGRFMANAAWASAKRWEPIWDMQRTELSELSDIDFDAYHVWWMDWTPTYIRIYLDDLLLNRISLRHTKNKLGAIENPFHQPHFIKLNLAVGGKAGGDPSGTTFPARFEVDYVRVYQKQTVE
ncbi:MAG: glycoside hydrolase family 16 protein [Saprospiraceae bacterium]|nr:glycoside hydrolase family 16 protein [Saprospiraceae bacterium]